MGNILKEPLEIGSFGRVGPIFDRHQSESAPPVLAYYATSQYHCLCAPSTTWVYCVPTRAGWTRQGPGELYERALAGYEAQLGPSHPDTLMTVNNLAILRYKQRRLDEALPLARRAASGFKEQLGADHPHTKLALRALASIEEVDVVKEAEEDYELVAANAQNAAVQESIEQFPAGISIAAHPHVLARMPTVHDGHYGCDLCGKTGVGWAYSCVECEFDCHPCCVVDLVLDEHEQEQGQEKEEN